MSMLVVPTLQNWLAKCVYRAQVFGSCPHQRAMTHSPPGPVTGEALCEKLSAVLEDIGPKKIILCISDSAANCKRAGQLLEERFPHITWLPCATHICDLALKVRMHAVLA